MPYFLSPQIKENMPPMWMEGSPYEKQNIYSINDGKQPPVNYDTHILRPHSMTHTEAESHVLESGKTIDNYFEDPSYFYGKCQVVKLKGNRYNLVDIPNNIYHWEVTLDELKEELSDVPEKLLLTTEEYPQNEFKYHDPSYVLTLSAKAAEWLCSNKSFNLYGTSWKSSDYQPGSIERPIHKLLFKRAIIFECLDLKDVPEGKYLFVGCPLRIAGASEAPVSPMLFEESEIRSIFS